MLKLIAKLEHVIGSRVFHLMCDHDSPIAEVREAIDVFLQHLDKIEQDAEKMKQAAADANPADPVQPTES